MSELQHQVAAFHKAFDHPTRSSPISCEDLNKLPERVAFRANLVTEEVFELLEALYGNVADWKIAREIVQNAIKQRQPRVDMTKAVDALGDIDFVVEGTRLEFGVEGDSVARAIFRANMAKVGGEKRADGKTMKPKQWTPPDIEGVLAKQASGEIPNLGDKLARWMESSQVVST